MELDNTGRYRFPKTLSEQLRILGLPLDELIPLIPVLAWGFWARHQLFGLIAACAVWFAIHAAKRGRGSTWLYNVMYWYLPGLRAGTVFRLIPDSSFRQWIR